MRPLIIAITLTLVACNTNGGSEPSPRAEGARAPATAEAPAAATESPAPAPAAATLTRVEDPSQVCMVNNQFMGREQIPVSVDGKTYFGCCEMCKGRLAKDPSARTAKDPVSGNVVDKSAAVIAKRDNGQVLYFESEQTLERYRAL